MKAKSPYDFVCRNSYYTTKKLPVNELNARLAKIGDNTKQRFFDNTQFVQVAHFFLKGLLHFAERKSANKGIMSNFC